MDYNPVSSRILN